MDNHRRYIRYDINIGHHDEKDYMWRKTLAPEAGIGGLDK